MKTIYNVYVPMESQEQCDRMKQLCVYYELPIWEIEEAFEYFFGRDNFFTKSHSDDDFLIFVNMAHNLAIENKSEVSEQEFIELLKKPKL